MNLAVGAKTDVGRVRQANEDSYLIDEPLFVVADGMGGHVAGDVASTTAVDTIREHSRDASSEDLDSLARIVKHANARIWEKGQGDPSLRGMGTTLTLLLIDDHDGYIAHVGDSRAYMLRDGKLTQLTEDHTLVGRMVREGRLTAEEAQHHPQRSMITRALGVDEDVQVDLLSVDLQEGDRILLCSDGLSSMVDHDLIASTLSDETDPQVAAERLIDLANDAGGEDNITVLLLDVTSEGGVRRHRSAKATSPSMPAATGAANDGSATAVQSPPSSADDTQAVAADGGGVLTEDHPPPPPREEVSEEDRSPRRRTWIRRLVLWLAIIAVLGVAAVVGVRYLIDNSWYVGAGSDGNVTIYNGIPEEIPGLTLREVHETTDLPIDDLPSFLQTNVRSGIKEESLADAEDRVAALQAQADRLQEQQERQRRDRPPRERRQNG